MSSVDEMATWLREQIAFKRSLALACVDIRSPNAMLAQCEAHEEILKLHVCDGPTLRALALAYQHRPGYREEWRP